MGKDTIFFCTFALCQMKKTTHYRICWEVYLKDRNTY